MRILNKQSILKVTLLLMLSFFIFSISSFTTPLTTILNLKKNIDINITIDSNTTKEELEDIKQMLKEIIIIATFSNIKRNDNAELVAIKIKIETDNGQSAVTQIKSSDPIEKISFGRKGDNLYITQGDNTSSNQHDISTFSFHSQDITSLFEKDSTFQNIFKFDEDGNSFIFNLDEMTTDIDSLKNKMSNMFVIENDEDGAKKIIIKGMGFMFNSDDDDSSMFSWFMDDDSDKSHTKSTYHFVDDPNTEKLIIINGKESDFKTLDELARKDQIDSIDVLKGKTATSIYGNKAKDGAIIATTKQ